jgi:hypothetical protein
MLCIQERNLHESLPIMCKLLLKRGYEVADGQVLRLDGPMAITLTKPTERLIFHRDFKLNPFSFFFAGMQMLFANVRGLQDFGKILREDKVGMPLQVNVNDTFVIFQRAQNRDLDAFVTGRSSDPVQDTIIVSTLQEMIAHLAGCGIGTLTWQSTNVHIDVERAKTSCEKVAEAIEQGSPYSAGEISAHKIIDIPFKRWHRELDTFSKQQHRGTYSDLFFSNIVVPIYQAGISLQQGQYGMAQAQLDSCFAEDWRKACTAWIISESINTP